MTSTAAVEDLKKRINEQAERLSTLVGADDKRIRKRVLQNLGKLKKQLLSATEDCKGEGQSLQKDSQNQSTVPLTNKKAKLKLKIVNNEISELALKKQLKSARKRFDWLIRRGISPDVHTYTNLLNAHVRCKDIQGAIQLWKDMNVAGIVPNVVTFTTLIRGFCELGQIEKALPILTNMFDGTVEPPLISMTPPAPNARTISSFVRGCVRVGAVQPAMEVVNRCLSDSHGRAVEIDLDEATFEYMTVLLCQALRVDEAIRLTNRFILQFSSSRIALSSVGDAFGPVGDGACRDGTLETLLSRELHPDAMLHAAAIFQCIARAQSLRGDFKSSDAYLHATKECLQACKSASVRHAMLRRLDNDGENKAGSVVGSRKSHGKKGVGASDSSHSSLGLFMQHRHSELIRACSFVEAYNSYWTNQMTKPSSGDGERSRESSLLTILSRSFLLINISPPENEQVLGVWRDSVLSEVLTRLGETFGLSNCPAARAKATKIAVMERVIRSFGSDFIDFDRMIEQWATGGCGNTVGETWDTPVGKRKHGELGVGAVGEGDRKKGRMKRGSGAVATSESGVEVRMEICSGSGEWIVEQARAQQQQRDRQCGEGKKVLYVALELRADRAHHTLCQAVLRQTTDNLAIIAGDASVVLPCLIRPSSVSTIFVNHPEPPERRSGGEEMSQGSHLLTESFFKDMHRVLRTGGMITIVTDNRLYAHALAKIVHNLNIKSSTGSGRYFACRFSGDDEMDNDRFYVHSSASFADPVATENAKTKLVSKSQQRVQRMESSDSDSDDSDSECNFGDDDNNEAFESHAAEEEKMSEGGMMAVCDIRVHPGEPGERGGHLEVGEASSYFSRMWRHGNKTRVWHLILTKS